MKKYFLYLYMIAMAFTLLTFIALMSFVKEPEALAIAEEGGETAQIDALPVYGGADGENAVAISKNTTMVYEYYYTDDGLTDTTEESPPHFLLDKTRDFFERSLPDWEVLEFSEEKVVLRKSVDGRSAQHYTLGVYEGFIAVFYDDEVNGTNLREITNTPINALSPEEQEKLRQGIQIKGDEDLYRALEDYGS